MTAVFCIKKVDCMESCSGASEEINNQGIFVLANIKLQDILYSIK